MVLALTIQVPGRDRIRDLSPLLPHSPPLPFSTGPVQDFQELPSLAVSHVRSPHVLHVSPVNLVGVFSSLRASHSPL